MWTVVILLCGFLLAAVVLSALTLYLNEFENKITQFCDVARERYRPTFHAELEDKASRQIETLAKEYKG